MEGHLIEDGESVSGKNSSAVHTLRKGHNHEDVTASNECAACEDSPILAYAEEHLPEACEMKCGTEEPILDTFNASEEVIKDSDENGTACAGVCTELGDTSTGKTILKGELDFLLEEKSSCVTPGDKVGDAKDVLPKVLFLPKGAATGKCSPLCAAKICSLKSVDKVSPLKTDDEPDVKTGDSKKAPTNKSPKSIENHILEGAKDHTGVDTTLKGVRPLVLDPSDPDPIVA